MEKENCLEIELINKEDLPNYKLVKAPVEITKEMTNRLRNALRLGNEFKTKCTMVLQTTKGPKKIETTIWSLTEGYLQIKSGLIIPLVCLLDVYY